MGPREDRPCFLIIGRVRKPWGYRGQVKVEILTDFPQRFSPTQTVYVGDEDRPFTVESVQLRKSVVVLKLKGCESQGDAEAMRGKYLWIPLEEAMPLEEGAYYLHEIVGLKVWTTQGEYLGEVKDILFTAGNDVYVVQGDGGEILIPAISSVVKEVNRAEGKLVIEPMEGLF